LQTTPATSPTAEGVAAAPTPLEIPIIDEQRDWLVINKPAGVAVHAGTGITGETIADWFTKRYPDAHDVGEAIGRAGIVHRLDKDTSGVLILAKTEAMYQ